jgi:hypothetical protein
VVVAKNQAGKKSPSSILKFFGNFESPIQSGYAGKFSVQSDVKRLFCPGIAKNIFENNIFLINLTRAYYWCMDCHTWFRKYFGQ